METSLILKNTKNAVVDIKNLSSEKRNEMLYAMAKSLLSHKEEILKANELDVEATRDAVSSVMIDRLTLTSARIDDMAKGITEIAALDDPLGEEISKTTRPNGLEIIKKRVPIGLIAIIYESRPNVTSDAAALSVKSGNACVLRGGKEAYRTSRAICDALKKGIESVGVNADVINLIDDTTRESATELMHAEGIVDLLIPRGGKGLISSCVKNATVPIIQTGTGICHVFVDESADIGMALDIIDNAKTSRPSVCNAAEVLLVHEKIKDEFLPSVKERLVDKRVAEGKIPVRLKLCEKASEVIEGEKADVDSFDTEFLDYILAIKVVSSVDEAVSHILCHSTGHSEAIITKNDENALKFAEMTDSAAVYVNASTRFTDGGEFGLGCEMGISTQKLHARGPMGIAELTTYKYVIMGSGQIR